MEAVVIRASGVSQVWPLKKKLTLDQYQMLVGGYIEFVKVRHDGKVCDMVLNEDGLNLGLPDNTVATRMLENYWCETIGEPWSRVPQGTVARVVGDVVVLHGCRL